MPSSDDYCGTLTRNVLDYEFVIDEFQPVSFSELPVEWNKGETAGVKKKIIFLSGTTDNGLRKIYKEVTSWRFKLSLEKPKISVLSKEGHRFILLNPKKSYMVYIRTILTAVHSLHFVKRNPQGSHEDMCGYLSKVLSVLEHKPLVEDMLDHVSLITEAVIRDGTLTKSKLLVALLEDNLRKRKVITKDDMMDENENNDPEENDKSGDDEKSREDDVCAICDNGGRLLICEGSCMRSFHPTVEDGADSSCPSLCYTDGEYEAIEKLDFYCQNCKHKQHQCFACGNLGSSDGSGAEVFRCCNVSCGHFYHPHCVAKLLHPGNMISEEDERKKIAGGEHFTCPRHVCHTCKGLELSVVSDFQFAICRRCPRAYHRKCLPRKIAFEKDVDESKGIVQRAWEGLIPNHRILIYCLKHEIDVEISTPARNHLKFPKSAGKQNVNDEKRKTQKVRSNLKTENKISKIIDAGTKKRVLTVMKNNSSSIKPEKIKKKHKVLSTHGQSPKFSTDLGLGRWVKSFVKVVDTLHWYVQDGDMIVDFHHDTNDISCLMKEKLDGVGKCCLFKHCNFKQLKTDFNFEGKDYVDLRLDVSVEQVRLIMVLSPPSGVDANLDECINKTSDYVKPKLLILIAPRETKRSYKMDFPYDLIWEDDQIFADDRCNLPGFTDSSGGRIEDGSGNGNGNDLILHLWSCTDLTTEYSVVAQNHGHMSSTQNCSTSEGRQCESQNIDEFLANLDENDRDTEVNVKPAIVLDPSAAHSKESNGMKRRRRKYILEDSSNSTDDHSPTKRTHEAVDNTSSKHLKRSSDVDKCHHNESDASTPPRTPCSGRSEQKSHPTPKTTSPGRSSVQRSRIRMPHLGFASGPCWPFSEENTAGWLEE